MVSRESSNLFLESCNQFGSWSNFILVISMLILVVTTFVLLVKNNKKKIELEEKNNLTGLYNLQSFCEKVSKMIGDKTFYIAFSDIEKFRLYNDTVGSRQGDILISNIGKNLRSGDFGKDLLLTGYFGADHFVLCLDSNNFDEEKVYTRFKDIFKKADPEYNFVLKLGFCKISAADDIRSACGKAEIAAGNIKNNHKKNYAIYNDNMYENIVKEEELLKDVKRALVEGEIVAYYQPQIDYNSQSVIGAEALIRWNHKDKGLVPPAAFIPILEKNGYIYEVDKYLWNYVAFKIHEWKEKGIDVPPISVNISRIDIYHSDFVDTFDEIVSRNRLKPSDLRLEITESAYTENPKVLIDTINHLKEHGYYLEMDDFGSGYSSLNTLKDLQFDLIKLDIDFMHQSASVGKGGSILSSVIRLVHQIDMIVISEGVETKAQADFLKSVGCYYMQGYYFSKPLEENEFLDYIEKSKVGVDKTLFESGIEDVADFLDDRTQSALLFNSFVGGAFIVDYSGSIVSAIRTNDLFYKEMNISRETWDECRDDFSKFLDESQLELFVGMLNKAIETKDDEDVNVYSSVFGEERKVWFHCRCRHLSRKVDSNLFYVYIENITKQVENEEHLAVSKAEYKAVAEQSSRLICRYIHKNRALVVNEEVAKRFHIVPYLENAPEEEVKQGLIDIDSVSSWRQMFADIEDGKEHGNYKEIKMSNLKGHARWFDISFTDVTPPNSDDKVAVLAFKDVTEERKIRRNRALKYGAIVKALSGVYSICISCNPSNNTFEMLDSENFAAKYFGNEGKYDDLITMFSSMMAFEEDKENFRKTFSRENIINSWKNGEKVLKVEHRALDIRNIVHYTETTCLLIEDPDSNDFVHLSLSRVIDEEKKNEEMLKKALDEATKKISISEQEAIIANSMTSLGRFICYYDIEKKTLMLPDEYAKDQGLPNYVENYPFNDEIMLDRLVNKEQLVEFKQFFNDINNGKKGGSMEVAFYTVDGRVKWEKDDFNTIFDESGKPVRTVISVEDTTLHHEEDYKALKANEDMSALLSAAFKNRLEYVCLINITTKEHEPYSINEGVASRGKRNYFDTLNDVAKRMKNDKDREELLINGDLNKVIKDMSEKGEYAFYYEIDGGKRRADYFFNDKNKEELILVVSYVNNVN